MTLLSIIALTCLTVLIVGIIAVPTEGKEGVIAGKVLMIVFIAIPFAVLLVGLVRG